MGKLFATEMKLRFHMGANELLYYLAHVPLIRRLIKDRYYAAYDAKIIFGVVSMVFGFFKTIIFSGILLAIYIGAPILLSVGDDNVLTFPLAPAIMYLTFFANVLLGAWMNNTVICLQYDADEYMMLHVMRADPKVHFGIAIFVRSMMAFLDVFLLIFFIGFGNYLRLALMIACARVISEAVQIWGYMHRKGFRKLKSAGNALFILVYLAFGFGYFLYRTGNVSVGWAYGAIALVVMLLLAAVSVWYLLRFQGYYKIAHECVLRESLAFKNTEDAAALSLAKQNSMNEQDEKHMVATKGLFPKKKGYAYMTALFFHRHYRLIRKRVIIKCIVFAAVLLIYPLATLVIPEAKSKEFYDAFMKLFAPAVVFVLYIASSGKQICSALFYNCDRVFLKYGYYRNRSTVIENFGLRIRYIIVADLIPAFVLCLFPFEVMLFTNRTDNVLPFIAISGMCLVLSVFFSVYHTFAYYICQPYTEEMKEQSKLFSLLNTVIYVLAYVCLQLNDAFESMTEVYGFIGIVFIITVLFLVFSFPFIYLVAPKRFRLR